MSGILDCFEEAHEANNVIQPEEIDFATVEDIEEEARQQEEQNDYDSSDDERISDIIARLAH